MTVEFGLKKSYWPFGQKLCDDLKCDRYIVLGAPYYLDQDKNAYCEDCGLCLRYERKKEAERLSDADYQ